MEKRREAFRLAVTRRGELLRCGVSPDRATGLDPHVVARSPDRATGLDRRSPKRCRSGDLRSRTVAGSGDPATTDLPSAGAETTALWPGLRTGPLAWTEGLPSGAGAETFGRGPWRGRETPPQRDLRHWLAWTEGLPSGAGAETFGRGPWRGPETPPQQSHNRPPRCGPVSGPGHWLGPKASGAVPERRPSVADRGGVRRPRHNGVSLRRSEANQSSPLMRLAPLSTMRIGRPMGVLFCFFQFTPSTSQTVAKKSSAETLPSTTFAPSGSVLPMTCPPLMPPPIMTVLQARG